MNEKYNWYIINEYLILLLREDKANMAEALEKILSIPISKGWRGYIV
jgi:hypothetical protein